MPQKTFEWAVVGAGPAGMASVAKLIDNNIDPKNIIWIDPEFSVGLLGKKWPSVSSNTKVSLFIKFLENAKAFDYDQCPVRYPLHDLIPEDTCKLSYIVEPLQWVTEQLLKKVNSIRDLVIRLEKEEEVWKIECHTQTIHAKKIILAIGSRAKTIDHPALEMIPLENALQIDLLKKACTPNDTIAVFGSSHSAIMIIRDALACGVKRVINFYRAPLRYAVYVSNGIINDNVGLKGSTAAWARAHIDENQPENLERYVSSDENLEVHIPRCTKAIYAIGFERESIDVKGLTELSHDHATGFIAPGLYGVGIAFPEGRADPVGNFEHQVGLWKFMDYLNRVMPTWLKSS